MYYDLIESGKRIRKLRKIYGYTQETLAVILNSSISHIGKIETGREGASIELLIEMTFIFHTSLDYIVLGSRVNRDVIKHKVKDMIEFLNAIDKEL